MTSEYTATTTARSHGSAAIGLNTSSATSPRRPTTLSHEPTRSGGDRASSASNDATVRQGFNVGQVFPSRYVVIVYPAHHTTQTQRMRRFAAGASGPTTPTATTSGTAATTAHRTIDTRTVRSDLPDVIDRSDRIDTPRVGIRSTASRSVNRLVNRNEAPTAPAPEAITNHEGTGALRDTAPSDPA